MYPQTLYPKTKQVLEKIATKPFLNNFYLAGGTALALQIGHRLSIDLDFFTANFPNRETILADLKEFSPTISQEAQGTLEVIINDVKTSFFEYKYPLLNPLANYNNITLASEMDILCMKLTAISSRGAKKDFMDLYFGLLKYDFNNIWDNFEKKYQGVNYQMLHILKSLTFFDDADLDPEPMLTQKVSWGEVKNIITQKILNTLNETKNL